MTDKCIIPVATNHPCSNALSMSEKLFKMASIKSQSNVQEWGRRAWLLFYLFEVAIHLNITLPKSKSIVLQVSMILSNVSSLSLKTSFDCPLGLRKTM